MSAERIAVTLRDHDVSLKIVLGGSDFTIPVPFGTFVQQPATLVEPVTVPPPLALDHPGIAELVLGGATHLTVRTDPRCLSLLSSYLSG